MTESVVVGCVLGAVLVGSGAVVQWIARSAASGRLEVNAAMGIRTSATMASAVAWKVAHERAERPMWWGGLCSIVGGLAAAVTSALTYAEVWSQALTDALLWGSVLGGALMMSALVGVAAVVGHRAAKQLG